MIRLQLMGLSAAVGVDEKHSATKRWGVVTAVVLGGFALIGLSGYIARKRGV